MLGKICTNGSKSVQLFFILSTYLALSSYENHLKRAGGSNSNHEIKTWYLKKMIKIFPLYWIYVFSYLVLNGMQAPYWCGSLSKISILNIVCNIFLVNGWNPWYINTFQVTWYLSNLMILYFLTPLIYQKINNFFQAVTLTCAMVAISSVVCACMCQLSYFFVDAYIWDAYWNIFSVFAEIPLFCYGICLYLGIRENKFNEMEKHNGLCVVIAVLALVILYNLMNHSTWGIFTLSLWGITFLGIIITLIIRPLKGIANNPFFLFLGKNSYGIYLSHWIIYYNFVSKYVIKKINIDSSTITYLLVYSIVLLCSCLISIICTVILKKPINIISNKVLSKNET